MDNKDSNLSLVNQRLLEAKSRITLNRIIEGVKEKDGRTIHVEYALEKFDNYVTRFNLSLSDTEFDYLKDMRVKMHDNNGLAPKHIIPKNEIVEPTVISVDFKARKVIKPH